MNKHIEDIEQADKLSFEMSRYYQGLTVALKRLSNQRLLNNINNPNWYNLQKRVLKDFQYDVKKTILAHKEKLKNRIVANVEDLQLSKKQEKVIKSQMNVMLKDLYATVITTHKADIEAINTYQLKHSTEELSRIVADRVKLTDSNGYKVYRDGKHFRWESYLEMKQRTEIQNDIANNMLEAGQEFGVVFYICASYGDCAKDHIDMQQQSIFFDEKWQSLCPKKYIDDVSNWISNHSNYLSIQQAMSEQGNYFTTRPNCRHFFQYISIEDVIGFKDKEDINKYQRTHDMFYKGKYRDDKTEALKQQRYNERKIRQYKSEIDTQKQIIEQYKGKVDKNAMALYQSELKHLNGKLSDKQEQQRELMRRYPSLDREYKRESWKTVVNTQLYK